MVLAAIASIAHADSGKTIRQQTELSMVVEAAIDIRSDGSVDHYAIKDPAKIPPSVIGIIERHVPRWKFEPAVVDGKPTAMHTYAWLKIIARPNEDGSYSAGIMSAKFSGGSPDREGRVLIRDKNPPVTFPSSGWVLMWGDVYLALKIGPDGKVMDGIVRRVDLTTSDTEARMAKARQAFGESALQAVRNWTFDVPTRGEHAGQPYWSGILPVIFTLDKAERPYGEWRAYLPGPCNKIPWRALEPKSPEGDGCLTGVETLGDDGPELLTPLM